MKAFAVKTGRWLQRTNWVVVSISFLMAVVSVGWVAWALHGPAIATWLIGKSEIDLASSGQWGDTFGAFNALFGALGFSAVFATLLIQGAALKRQQDDVHLQRFEGTFFELLGLLRELRSQITFRHSPEFIKLTATVDETFAQSAAIAAALREVEFWLSTMEAGEFGTIDSDEVGATYEKYVHRRNEAALAPYFRVMYTILRRISTDRVLTTDQRKEYGNLLRAQLTSDDIALAGYNSVSNVSGNLVDYVIEFRILRYLPPGARRDRFSFHLGAEALAPRGD